MINIIILVFVGGAFGAMCREFFMLGVPHLANGFPLDIFIANVVACFLLGLSVSAMKKSAIHPHVHAMVGTGIMGGLSTFSSFVYGGVILMQKPSTFLIGSLYIVGSVIAGFIAMELGLALGRIGESVLEDNETR